MGPGGGGGGFGNAAEIGRGGSFATLGQAASGGAGSLYGISSLLPIIGGSGGGGGGSDRTPGGSELTGSSGGGAILIASSTTIDVSGSILAIGGSNIGFNQGGDGSGGAIRLMANTVSGAGRLDVFGGDTGFTGFGFIRLEAFTFTFSGQKRGVDTVASTGLVFPPSIPTVQITQVDGTAVPSTLFGGAGGVDLTLAAPGTFAIDLAASKVPLGTTIAVTAKPETDGDVIGPVTSPALAGTLDSSTATVNLDFPTAGVYFLEARATFAVP